MRNWKSYLSTPLAATRNLPRKGKTSLVICGLAIIVLTTGATAFASLGTPSGHVHTASFSHRLDATATVSTVQTALAGGAATATTSAATTAPTAAAATATATTATITAPVAVPTTATTSSSTTTSTPSDPPAPLPLIFRAAGGSGPLVIVTLTLPPGLYLLDGSAQVSELAGRDRGDGSCSFSQSASDSVPNTVTVPPGGSEVLTRHDTLELPPSKEKDKTFNVTFTCRPSRSRPLNIKGSSVQPHFADGDICFSHVVFTAIAGKVIKQP